MNRHALAALGRDAHAWAKAYTAVKEALLKEGVKEEEAQQAATTAANTAALWEVEHAEDCPLCGGGS